jgi:predicted membrane channel-forming protein YqfA (hemolysin III family)
LAWERTHRAATWLFMTAGVLLMAMSGIQRVWWMIVVLAYFLAGVLALMVYSYRLWRIDPERTM